MEILNTINGIDFLLFFLLFTACFFLNEYRIKVNRLSKKLYRVTNKKDIWINDGWVKTNKITSNNFCLDCKELWAVNDEGICNPCFGMKEEEVKTGHTTESLLTSACDTMGKVIDRIDLKINGNSDFYHKRVLPSGEQKKTFSQLKQDCLTAIEDLRLELDHIYEERN